VATILSAFRSASRAHPDRKAVVHCLSGGRTASLALSELDRRSDELAAYLAGQAIASGDLVGVVMRRSIDHVVAILDILKTGAAFYSLNPRSTWEQVAHAARISEASTVLVDYEALLNLRNISAEGALGFTLTLYASEPPAPFQQQILDRIRAAFPLVTVPEDGSGPTAGAAPQDAVGCDVALALFTSGSTGAAKGVLISHQDLYNRVSTECEYFGTTPDDVLLNLLPFSFDVGANQLFSSLATGARLVILNSWMPVDIASAITQHRVTGISAVPAIWTSVLNMLDPQPVAAALRQVRYITVSGGDLPPGHLTRLADLLPGTQIFKTYGQSETFRSGILLPSEFRQKMLSVGRPVRGTQVFIVNARRKQALPNEAGEILHLGEGTMLGYLGDPKGTRRKLRANPLQRGRGPCRQLVVFTGDIGRIDEDGYLYVLGRKDKMIKSSGYRVYPKEVCDQILRHPCAEDAAVFGIPDPTLGQVIVAEVQTKSDCSLTERDLKTFLADKLPSYMLPGRIALVSAFPRTPSGKIRLAEVEAKYREQE
jgi:acyl-CoA synthetase (AMP-forming)/AMP-acid ligase II